MTFPHCLSVAEAADGNLLRNGKRSKSSKGQPFPSPYDVTHIPKAELQNYLCQNLANAEKSLKYRILAEDYMIQTNLIVTGTDDPESFYEQNIAPRQNENIIVSAPSVGVEALGTDEVRQLFVGLASNRMFAYHIWDQIRVCQNDDDDSYTVFMREYGLVQEEGQDMIKCFYHRYT
ncbi:predicted protein [Chaetoceros tenuissimus]|uniref:Uncharacterized protein n=1 Tax=Chaetoceros tenuissimus TaxID=426638 RepID=A0AAD3DBN1_9STRA|nr:predicted protein [Chaetoceros tenuissimus]